jgi:hypothetical protein
LPLHGSVKVLDGILTGGVITVVLENPVVRGNFGLSDDWLHGDVVVELRRWVVVEEDGGNEAILRIEDVDVVLEVVMHDLVL